MIGTSPGDSLPWFHGGLQGDEDQTVTGEGDTNFDSLQEDQGEGIHISERICQINWQDDSNPPCNLPSPVMVQRASVSNQTYQRSQSFETTMILNQEALLELDWWSIRRNLMDGKSVSTQEPDLTMETDASMLGWGAVCQGIRTGGLWSQMERKNHINYLELLAARFGVKALAKDRRNIHIRLRMDNRTAVFCESNWGDSFPGVEQPSNSTLAVVLGEEFVHHSRASSWGRQLCGRRGIQGDSIDCRVAVTPTDISTDPGIPWQLQHRPVCNSPQYSVETVCELETRSRLSGERCPTAALEQVGGICLPSLLPNWQVCQEGQRGQGFSDTSSTSLEVTAVVPSITRTVSGLSPDAPTNSEALVRPIRQATSFDGNRPATTSRLESIRHRQQADGISSEASQLLAAGWSRGTNTTYESAWRRWDSWYSERQVDPISCAIQPFLEFLTSLFKEGLQY